MCSTKLDFATSRLFALPACPWFTQGCSVLRVYCEDAAAGEAAVQQLHAVAPDHLKGVPADGVAGLLWVHT